MSSKREHKIEYFLKEVFASWNPASFFFRYTFVFLSIAITILLKWEFRQLYERSPFLLLMFPVVLSVFIGGMMAGVMATVISAIVVNYLFVSPSLTKVMETANALQTASFVLEGIVASALITFTIRWRDREYRLRQWYEVTLESIGDAVIATDNEGYIMYMNKVAEKLTGWKLIRAYSRPLTAVFNIVEENTGSRAGNPTDQAIREDRIVSSDQIVLISKKGMEIPIDASAAPIKDIRSESIGIILVFHDVTGQRKIKEALRLSEERLRLALNHTNIMAWGQDRRFRYTWVHNVSFPGYSPGDIIGKTDRQMKTASEANIGKLELIKREVIKTKSARTTELNIGTAEKPTFLEVTVQPEIDWRGEVKGIYGISVNITKRKLMEEKKDEFMSIASHELRTPLTSIKGYVQILEKMIQADGNSKAMPFINRTKMYVEKLNSLISDLLDVTKIQAGKLQLNLETFDLDDLVEQSIESAQMVSDTHKIIKQGAVHILLKGDKSRLEQVLTNLLSNAVKYSPKADKVIVNVKKENRHVVVSIQDFGIGIPASSRPRLFSRFYRVEQSAGQFAGLGIGLYISHEIVKRHGGMIQVASEVGKGSTFSCILPIKAIPT